ncbi:MAG: (d)CMP kinase [Candidatus Aphodosoma sp.]|nr:(d)CMP kinase [Candidatus Aphodosoma sp.]
MKKIIVAIDGYSSCGKSTMAKALAEYAGYTYIDTGAMYRAVALFGIRKGIITPDEIDENRLKSELCNIQIGFRKEHDKQHTILNGEDVEALIRTMEVADGASRVSTIGFVRKHLVALQQQMGRDKGIVMDGRDITTVVFPDAELKIFVTAAPETRAQRRYNELIDKGERVVYEDILKQVVERDYRDSHRSESPLTQTADSLLLDNTTLNKEEQFQLIKSWFDKVVAE